MPNMHAEMLTKLREEADLEYEQRLRAIALELAVRSATPGIGDYWVEQRANNYLKFIKTGEM